MSINTCRNRQTGADGLILDRAQAHYERYRTSDPKMTPFVAFYSVINGIYHFTRRWTNEMPGNMVFEDFYALFADISKPLPDWCVRSVADYFSVLRRLIADYHTDSEFYIEVAEGMAEHRRSVQELKEKSDPIMRILGEQVMAAQYYEQIDMVAQTVKLRESPAIFLYMYLFNYGYIEGKRAERARRHRAKGAIV